MAIWTQDEINRLKAAIASGVLTVRYADRTVTYQSLEAMRSLLAEMVRDVAAQNGGTSSYRLANTRKGC